MFSAYRNTKARKNIISLTPDYEWSQIIVSLCIIGIVGAFVVVSFIRNDVRKSAKVYYYPADYCLVCHGARENPKIKNLGEYKKVHPALSQKRLLDDLRVSQ